MTRPTLWLLAGVQFTLLLDFMLLMPLGPELLHAFDISATGFGWAVSAYTFASALAGLSGFFWIDRLPRRGALLLLYASFIAATLACSRASALPGLVTARIIAGACAGLLWSVILALIVDSVPVPQRGSALALVMTSYSVSAVAGVPLGLLLAGTWGWRAPFYVLAALAVLLWFGMVRLLPQPSSGPQLASESDRRPSIIRFEPAWLLGWSLSFTIVFAGFLLIPYLGAFLVNNLGVASDALGWFYLAAGAATFGSLRFVGWLVDRYGPLPVLVGLLPLAALSHWYFAQLRAASLPLLVGAFVSFMVLTSGRVIPTLVLISARVAPRARGRFLAVNTAATDAASGLATWLSGALMETTPRGALVGFGRVGALAALCAVLAMLLSRRVAKHTNLAPPEFQSADTLRGAE